MINNKKKLFIHSLNTTDRNGIINVEASTVEILRNWTNCFSVRIPIRFAFFLGLIFITIYGFNNAQAQEIDILLKGGHVIDPKNKIDSKMDVAITNGKVLMVAPVISSEKAKKVIDVTGMFVTPGLIDIHAHAFLGTNGDYWNDGPNAVQPDAFTFRCGVTTIVDPGSMGWRTFPAFKKQTIDQSETRVLALLNIVGSGMRLLYEQDSSDMDPKVTARAAKYYKDYVVGIKTAHYFGSFTAVDRTVEAGRLADMPVMIDFGDANPPLSLEDLLMKRLRPGDIYTHAFTSVSLREHVVDKNGKVKPFIFEAQKRGIIFDVGFGGGSCGFNQLIPSIKQGFLPDVISTDLHIFSMNAGMKSMSNVMSMFLSLGVSIQDVILRSSWKPANVINRKDLGNLSPGVEADVAVFKVIDGDFGFQDAYSKRFNGTKKLESQLTLRAGKIVWNLNGLGATMWDEAPIKY